MTLLDIYQKYKQIKKNFSPYHFFHFFAIFILMTVLCSEVFSTNNSDRTIDIENKILNIVQHQDIKSSSLDNAFFKRINKKEILVSVVENMNTKKEVKNLHLANALLIISEKKDMTVSIEGTQIKDSYNMHDVVSLLNMNQNPKILISEK